MLGKNEDVSALKKTLPLRRGYKVISQITAPVTVKLQIRNSVEMRGGTTIRRAAFLCGSATAFYFGPFLPAPSLWPAGLKRWVTDTASSGKAKIHISNLGKTQLEDSFSSDGAKASLNGTELRTTEGNRSAISSPEALRMDGTNELSRVAILSIVIPVYNESSQGLKRLLDNLQVKTSLPGSTEVILVDAGCTDDSFDGMKQSFLLHRGESNESSMFVRVTNSTGGRGPALCAGLQESKGDLILFLHADTELPSGYDQSVRSQLTNPDTVLCAFQFGIDFDVPVSISKWSLNHIERTANMRSKTLWLPYGDQAMAISREKLETIGSIKPLPMMEDFDLVVRARAYALQHEKQISILPDQAKCSPRRWEKYGVLATTARNWFFVAAYVWGGVSPETIFKWYYNKA